jgi:hypothetical protein
VTFEDSGQETRIHADILRRERTSSKLTLKARKITSQDHCGDSKYVQGILTAMPRITRSNTVMPNNDPRAPGAGSY